MGFGEEAGQDVPSGRWHAVGIDEVLRDVDGNRGGLTEEAAEARLRDIGPNQLPRAPAPTLAEIFLRQFRSPLIYVLAAAAMVSLSLGEIKDAAFIFGVLLINAIIGTVQENRAEHASRALQQLLKIRATVRRDAQVKEIDAELLVPGDVVYLESGNRVPADSRIISAHGLEADESLLTGESVPVLKQPDWIGDADTPLADRHNMVHAGSIISRGRCQAVVVGTGIRSAIGRLALDVLAPDSGKPPLVYRMEQFTRWIAIAVLTAAAIVAVLGTVLGGYSVTEMFMFGVALAVSAIPEGLPVALTVALAIGTTRMARRGVIVRHLTAVEGLGSCTLIASDKTGTLTCNELTVRQVRLPGDDCFDVTGQGFIPEGHFLSGGMPIEPDEGVALADLARAVVLCNEADLHHIDGGWTWRGDPTDVALLTMAYKLGWRRETSLEHHPQVNEIPFEAERQFAATFHRVDGRVRAMVKGAPERVLEMCDDDPETLDRLLEVAQEMAREGYRILAVADGIVDGVDDTHAPPAPDDLRPLGLVGMIDPLRQGVGEAVAQARRAGVETIMVTGDHPVTALAISKDLGLTDDATTVVTGTELTDAGDEGLVDVVSKGRVFARVAPHQKLEIVNAAREAGHFVAVTGDGANDAPALKAANIGVAMGKSGTDVAREAAELVLSDDHFATITAGIEEGRIAYDNIRNVIYLLVSTGFAEVVLVALAISNGMPLPLLPVQLLWLNLVTNGIQDVALAFEPGHQNVLKRGPRPPGESIFNRLMIERTVIGALLMGVVGFALFSWAINSGWSESAARNGLLLLMVLFENVHLFNCRSETRSAFALSPLKSPVLLIGMIVAFSIHVSMLYLPWGNLLLSTEPVSLDQWLMLAALSLSILFVMELHKLSWALRHGAFRRQAE
ncbi:MAG: HAD-IC family P-type ATPase [Gammaproteobacteria bacterium]|nr:MAG: HAD-IC family P-type ATPase [Gammaproteobacteria bacterium]